MKNLFKATLTTVLILLPILPSVASPKLSRKLATLNCPQNSTESLTAWRDQLAELILKGEPDQARRAVEDCFGIGYEKIPACLDDAYDYAMFKIFSPPDDKSLIKEIEEASVLHNPIQKVFDLPEEFWVPDPKKPGQYNPDRIQIPANIEKLAAERGWYFLPYRTRSAGGFDQAPNLVLIAIPNYQGKPLDIYIQISPPTEGLSTSWLNPRFDPKVTPYHIGQDSLTMIMVDRSKNPPEGFLKVNKKSGQPTWEFSKKGASSSCISCHTSPALPISPRGYLKTNTISILNEFYKEEKMSDEDTKTTMYINNMMTSVKNMAWARGYLEKTIDGQKRMVRFRTGPLMDSQPYSWAPPNSSTRKSEFLQKCISDTSFTAYTGLGDYTLVFNKPSNFVEVVKPEKVKAFMNCMSCHNGITRGYLHDTFDFSQIRFRVLADQSMPPFSGHFEEDGSLFEPNLNERLALTHCLSEEHRDKSVREAWKKSGAWMKRQACFPDPVRAPKSVELPKKNRR